MVMSLPQWIRHLLTEDGRERVRASVHTAEKRTRGQIVPMVVRRSASVGHVPKLLTALILSLCYVTRRGFSAAWLPWGHGPWLALGVDIAVALILGHVLARFAWVRRLLVSRADRHHAAWMRAEVAFYRHGIDKTKGGTGVLLFMSVEDRQAVVLADKAIAAKVPREVWDEICQMLLRGARQGDIANGYQAAIQRSASVLEKHFPAKGKHPNELPDKLVIEA
jgi:putative membrane protein